MIFNCDPVNPSLWPMRLAGTWKQYSKNAMPQLRNTTIQSGAAFSRSEAMCPYQAKVMKTFETISSSAVFTGRCSREFGLADGVGATPRGGGAWTAAA